MYPLCRARKVRSPLAQLDKELNWILLSLRQSTAAETPLTFRSQLRSLAASSVNSESD